MQMILAQQIVWATSLTLSKTSILTSYSKVFTVSYFILAAEITAVVIFLWFVYSVSFPSKLPQTTSRLTIWPLPGACRMLVVILGSFLICQALAMQLGPDHRWPLRKLNHSMDVPRGPQHCHRSHRLAPPDAIHLQLGTGTVQEISTDGDIRLGALVST